MNRRGSFARIAHLRHLSVLLAFTVLAFEPAQANQPNTGHASQTRSRAVKAVRTAALASQNERLWDMRTDQELPFARMPELSPAAQRVSRIADRNGDKNFVMVDKVHGRLILFHDGRPSFIWPALTGESIADRLPADAVYRPVSQQTDVKYKVTPAGRFTMSRGYDDALGATLDINELQGDDWLIAIHRVSLANGGQRRDARLRSLNDEDKHITEGCIDVDPTTVTQLLRRLPDTRRFPIYILPTDERLIGILFQ